MERRSVSPISPETNSLLTEERHEDVHKEKSTDPRHPDAALPPLQFDDKPRSAPAKLFRRSYMLILVLLYGCLVIISWVIVCIQSKRPITYHTYDYVLNADNYKGELTNRIKSNEEWFKTVQVLLGISNTLIIPLTSAVCAGASTIYVQNYGRRRGFSMLHTTTLADKGWSSPDVWLDLLSIKGWRSRGSWFLAFAMVFHLLGFLIAPLQQYFIGQTTFPFQTSESPGFQGGTDVCDLLSGVHENSQSQIANLRNQLTSVSSLDYRSNLWQEGSPHCVQKNNTDFKFSDECYQGGTTFKSISTLLGPYIAQLPSNYSTGLTTQFLPRMNSSISFDTTSLADFPQDCENITGAYYQEYTYNDTVLNLRVCIPYSVANSPWTATRNRQDISEQVFLDIGFGTAVDPVSIDRNPSNTTFKVVVNTTLGYFELPNYKKSNAAGPLLARFRDNETCPPALHRKALSSNETESSYMLGKTPNEGPLAAAVAALFEPGSFIATQIPDQRRQGRDFYVPSYQQPSLPCTVPPMNLLLDKPNGDACVHEPLSADDGYGSVRSWLLNFYNIDDMQNALHASVILASQVWLSSANGRGNLDVFYDMGQDFIKPKISNTGVIFLSILIALDLFLLLALATYINFSHTWTSTFDASTMMRLGAARAWELPLQINSSGGERDTQARLEQMPGWVGDARPDDEDAGVLALGAFAPLKAGRTYVDGSMVGKSRSDSLKTA